jgi:hypothetical protein
VPRFLAELKRRGPGNFVDVPIDLEAAFDDEARARLGGLHLALQRQEPLVQRDLLGSRLVAVVELPAHGDKLAPELQAFRTHGGSGGGTVDVSTIGSSALPF